MTIMKGSPVPARSSPMPCAYCATRTGFEVVTNTSDVSMRVRTSPAASVATGDPSTLTVVSSAAAITRSVNRSRGCSLGTANELPQAVTGGSCCRMWSQAPVPAGTFAQRTNPITATGLSDVTTVPVRSAPTAASSARSWNTSPASSWTSNGVPALRERAAMDGVIVTVVPASVPTTRNPLGSSEIVVAEVRTR